MLPFNNQERQNISLRHWVSTRRNGREGGEREEGGLNYSRIPIFSFIFIRLNSRSSPLTKVLFEFRALLHKFRHQSFCCFRLICFAQLLNFFLEKKSCGLTYEIFFDTAGSPNIKDISGFPWRYVILWLHCRRKCLNCYQKSPHTPVCEYQNLVDT